MTTLESDIEKIISKLLRTYEENLEFFKQVLPPIYRQIVSHNGKPNIIIDPSTLNASIEINGKDIYKGKPVDYCKRELDTFNRVMSETDYTPDYNGIRLANLVIKDPFKKTIENYKEITQHKTIENFRPSHLDVFVFGVGLGYHVEMLVNQNKFSHIVIIENDMSIFKASMHTVKWKNILSSIKPKHHITFLINSKNEIDEFFKEQLRTQCFNLFPSTSISNIIYNHSYAHLPDYKIIKHIIADFTDHMKLVSEKLAPEIHRLFNATHNIKQGYKCINFDKTKLYSEGKLVCVVGSGPSLDIYSDLIINNRDKLILISAGSTLSTLLKMGVKPDIHFELEFQVLASDLLNYVNDQYDISGIDLVSTYEANPGYPKLFNQCYMFIPESSELQELFDQSSVLKKGGLTCTNGATAFTSRIYKGDIYLLGTDFAFTGGYHHSLKNASNDKDLPENLSKMSGKNFQGIKLLSIESNTGEVLKTSNGLKSANITMSHFAKYCDNKIYNCSYGSKIDNTIFLDINGFAEKINSLNDSENNKKGFAISNYELDSISLTKRTEELIKNSLNIAKKIKKIVSKLTDNSFDNYYIIKNQFNLIAESCKGDNGQFRNSMSFVKQPLIQLSVLINFIPKEKQLETIEIWKNDFDKYINEIEVKLEKIKLNDYLLSEDIVDKKIKG